MAVNVTGGIAFDGTSVATTTGGVTGIANAAVMPITSTAAAPNLGVALNNTASGIEVFISTGTATPTGTVQAGSMYINTAGTLGAHLYISNGSGTWTAVSSV